MFKILDLFCGCGGMSYGFESVKQFETKIGVDFNTDALKTFATNFPDSYTIEADVKNKKQFNSIIELAKENKINMIIGGPPCQGFSLKGKKRGLEDERNYLFMEYFNFVEKISPEIFVIENVKELLTSSDGFFISQIERKCKKLGYNIQYDVFNAVDFGVPQNRYRAIIIVTKKKIDKISPNKIKEIKTVKDAIYDLAFLKSGEGEFKQDYKKETSSKYQEQLKDSEYLYNHIATNHSNVALEKLSMIPPEKGKEFLPIEMHGKQKFSTTWGRLEWDKPSPTIDTRFDTPSNGKNSHPFLNRSITMREAARIQSFNDSFIFYGKKTEICKQIGNAVPPLLSKAIGEEIARKFLKL
ncbi:MAG: DNA cytosine methyltransferase [Alphaproteobacteria bacterium]|nr:DNA cytosine methyltransferase [Alphaproteobacteria bacterium]